MKLCGYHLFEIFDRIYKINMMIGYISEVKSILSRRTQRTQLYYKRSQVVYHKLFFKIFQSNVWRVLWTGNETTDSLPVQDISTIGLMKVHLALYFVEALIDFLIQS
jgi:hypothetical protein